MTLESAFVGLVVAVLFTEIVGIYPGGIIVPAYVALFVNQPLRLVGTLAVALLAWGTYCILTRWLIVFGRRRFLLLVLLGGVWALVGYRWLPAVWPETLELRTIGWVIPGLIANAMERQGATRTLLSMGIASGITYLILRWLGAM